MKKFVLVLSVMFTFCLSSFAQPSSHAQLQDIMQKLFDAQAAERAAETMLSNSLVALRVALLYNSTDQQRINRIVHKAFRVIAAWTNLQFAQQKTWDANHSRAIEFGRALETLYTLGSQ
jgi:hypothetical protein